MSEARHDAIWTSFPGKEPMLLVVFMQNKEYINDNLLFPAIANELSHFDIPFHY